MRRPLATALLTVTALLALTGCLKLDADIEVHEDETISGTMTLGMSKDAVEMLDSMAEGFGETSEEGGPTGGVDEEFFDEEEVPEGAEVEPYEDDKFVGQTMTFADITIDELNSSTADSGEDEWRLTHEDGTYVFEGSADFSAPGGEEAEDTMGFERLLEQAEMEISMTFPGEVSEANGEIDGRTVTWRPKFGQRLTMRAEASDSDSFPVWPLAGGLTALLVLGGLAWLAVRARRSRVKDGS